MTTINYSKATSEIKDKVPLRKYKVELDACLACGTCSAGCPIAGMSGFDPRKMVRMVLMGKTQEIIDSNLPWLCTMCGKCEYACPMGINIAGLTRTLRGAVDRDKVPKSIQSGIDLCIKSGNNIGLRKDDFEFIIEDAVDDLTEDEPEWEGLEVPVDKKGANLFHTLHNKLVNTQTEDIVHWWKIFDQVDEDWTITSENWEGVNWGIFSGDDDAMKMFVGRIVEKMTQLEIANLMYPE
jgi:heterodisulfide reductase subunit C